MRGSISMLRTCWYARQPSPPGRNAGFRSSWSRTTLASARISPDWLEAGRQQVADKLVVAVQRAHGMVDSAVDPEQPGDQWPVPHADLGQGAPLLPAPLPGVRPVAVTEVVLEQSRT